MTGPVVPSPLEGQPLESLPLGGQPYEGLPLGGLLRGLDHVGLAVPDLEQAIAFHTQVLGLALLHREDNPDQDVVEAMLGFPAGRAATQVQLVAPLSAESVIARFLERRGPGLHHLAYGVADVDQAADALRGQGLRLLYDRGRRGTRGSRINFVHPKGTGGVLTELVEVAEPASAHPSRAAGRAQRAGHLAPREDSM